MKSCVVVTGMHRSGTSALMGILNILGISLGLSLMKPAKENPKGFFENYKISQFNERILESLDSFWDDILLSPEKWWEKDDINVYLTAHKEEAIEIIKRECRDDEILLGIKDPRLSLLLPFWKTIFKELNIRPHYVICVRNPLEVAESLKKRNSFTPEKSLLLWMNYMLNAEFYSRNSFRVFVSFDELLKNPEKTINTISKTLEIDFPKAYCDVKIEIEQFLEPKLKHHIFTQDAVNKDLLELILKFYRLVSLPDKDKIDDHELFEINTIREQFLKIHGLFYHEEIRNLRWRLNQAGSERDHFSKRLNEIYRSDFWKVASFYYRFRDNIPSINRLHRTLGDLKRKSKKKLIADTRLKAELAAASSRINTPRYEKNPYVNLQLLKDIKVSVLDIDFKAEKISTPFSLVTTIRNEAAGIVDFLKSIEFQNLLPDEVIIVDGGSIDNTTELVEEYRSYSSLNIKFIKSFPINIAKGRNIGIKEARNEILVLTDAGCKLERDFCKNLVGCFSYLRDLDLAGGIYKPIYFSSIFPIDWEALDWQEFIPSARSMAIKRCLALDIGGFPEYLTLTGEDTLFNINYRRVSNRWAFNKKSVIYWNSPRTEYEAYKVAYAYGKGDGESGIGDFRFYEMFYGQLKRHRYNNQTDIKHPVQRGLFLGYVEGRKNRSDIEIEKRNIKGVILILSEAPFTVSEKKCSKTVLELIAMGYKVVFVSANWHSSTNKKIWFDTDYSLLELYFARDFDWEEFIERYKKLCEKIYVLHNSNNPVLASIIEKLRSKTGNTIKVVSNIHKIQKDCSIMSRPEVKASPISPTPIQTIERCSFDKPYPKVSIILVTYNNIHFTKACIESIYLKSQYPNFELIIVDNNSQDDTKKYLAEISASHNNIKIILNVDNKGFASANNQGIKIAEGDYIILLNNDTIVTPGWITKLLSYLKNQEVGMVGPVTNMCGNEAIIYVPYDEVTLDGFEDFVKDYYKGHSEQDFFEIDMLSMYCVALRRDTVEEIGLLDERFRIGTFEDTDYSKRLKMKGYKLICAKDVFIHHHCRASFGKLQDAEYLRIYEENRRKYEEKWGEKSKY